MFSLTDRYKPAPAADPDPEAYAQAVALVTKHRLAMIQADIAAEAAAQREIRNLPANLERRFVRHLDIRAEKSNGKKILAGHAARFGKLSEDLGGFRERLAAGCFARSLRQRPDVLMLRGHDVNAILARCSNQTLAVAEDDEGLKFECTLSDTQIAADTHTEVKSGLITGMSFGMIVRAQDWGYCDPSDPECDDDDDDIDGEDSGPIRLRTVTDCDLLEISCVPLPAYPASDVNARAMWPLGVPEIFPLEIRSLIIGGQLSAEDQDNLRTEMRFAAIRATL